MRNAAARIKRERQPNASQDSHHQGKKGLSLHPPEYSVGFADQPLGETSSTKSLDRQSLQLAGKPLKEGDEKKRSNRDKPRAEQPEPWLQRRANPARNRKGTEQAARYAIQHKGPGEPKGPGIRSRLEERTGSVQRLLPSQAERQTLPAPESRVPLDEIHSPVEVPTPEALPTPGSMNLLMPEPPTDLSDSDRRSLELVGQRAAGAGSTQEQLPSAGENLTEARQAVDEPVQETTARVQGGLAAALSARPAPTPEIDTLCERILAVIRSQRPPDEESLLRSNPAQEAQAAGGMLESSVETGVAQVEGGYQQLNERPQATPQQQAQALETPPDRVTSPEINVTEAVPGTVPAAALSLEADVAASATHIQTAGMSSDPAQLVQSGPIADARVAQGELTTTAERDPGEILAEQEAAQGQAAVDMTALQQLALETLQTARAGTIDQTAAQQLSAVASEEQLRAQIGTRAEAIFGSAQTQVNTLLEPLTATATQRWESGIELLSTRFEQDLDRIERWKRERYEGVGGAILEVWEGIVGLPDWVVDAYSRAEQNFGEGVCRLIRDISTEVNSVIATCEQLIDDANRQITDLFNHNLPANLQQWAAGEQAQFAQRLQGLHERVTTTRDDFNHDLADRAAHAVQEVRGRIHELRLAAGGLIGRIHNAVDRFLEDPARFIIEGLLELTGIPPATFWAVINRIQSVIQDIADDPLGFANNLVNALGQGFQRFFDHFSDHILGGFFDWLFSGLGAVGVNIPSDFSLRSIITFFLELMGITWQRIRQMLARHIGEDNVALIERAYEIIADLIAMGPKGIFELLKEQLDPRNILNQVLHAAVDFLVEVLITRVAARVITMFNPAGAIIQAIELIYRVLRWIFDNAARIFSLVETIINGAAALIAGNITGMA
ncbi:MAG: hypothetical protein GY934_21330, partial [Gammaproteobacteria bacterium]|nr:hypothetical protein [Gammaproteobacteria bacterium]